MLLSHLTKPFTLRIPMQPLRTYSSKEEMWQARTYRVKLTSTSIFRCLPTRLARSVCQARSAYRRKQCIASIKLAESGADYSSNHLSNGVLKKSTTNERILFLVEVSRFVIVCIIIADSSSAANNKNFLQVFKNKLSGTFDVKFFEKYNDIYRLVNSAQRYGH